MNEIRICITMKKTKEENLPNAIAKYQRKLINTNIQISKNPSRNMNGC